ncbi:hypothetical protein AAYQ05_09115 [Flavobacterium sp. B11]|uniref:hypothetical protein n=1 Tax=Flavobacterium TaxID=237 RepID=UPI00248ED751|nr:MULTISPECIES: hypothetical protein [Flavobacterium]MDQ6469898.1 hypothetical protein [Flavobacterium sp. LHD-80]
MKISSILISLIFLSCVKDKKQNSFYDKVEYYHSDHYNIPGPPDGTKKFDIYYSDFVEKKAKTTYENLSHFGFVKIEISNNFSEKIDDFFTNQNPGKYYPDYKCLNCYQDILIFYKKNKMIGVAKFDFRCNKYCYSNFNSDKIIYLKKDCLKYRNLFKE